MKLSIFRLFVHGAPRHYLVDKKFLRKLRTHTWRFMPKQNRAWAVIRRGLPRMMLHRYIVRLAGFRWVEVYFDNEDAFDCRIGNLRPYNREEDGARRKRFKNNKSGHRGVHFKAKNFKNKWGASIRVRKKLQHLGYFPTPQAAARAYRDAYNLAHPNHSI